MTGRAAERGITFLELVIATTVLTAALSLTVGLFRTTNAVRASSEAHARAMAAHRRALETLTNILLAADPDTLGNFDPITLTAEEPTFERVTEVVSGEPMLGGPESLEWRPVSGTVPGVTSPGAIFHVTATGVRIVADRARAGSFRVRRDGRTLTIQLATYHPRQADDTIVVEGGTSLTSRNGS